MNSRVSIAITGVLAILLVLAGITPANAAGNRSDGQVCDATADYFLGQEDYGEAIATHRRLIVAHPADALAHYHLGFAYGMTGEREQEVAEYRKAAALGSRQWDLYLNLGRALLEAGNLDGAAKALQTSVALAPERPEGHFNLGLADERRGMLAVAREELATSLRLDPKQPDARNMMGLIYAEERDYTHAREVWNGLARTEPDFEPARANLAVLNRLEHASDRAAATEQSPLRTAFAIDSH
jgi:Flp pilus assembly protein TadD